MTTVSPPKPWERAGSTAPSGTSTPITSTAMTAPSPMHASSASASTDSAAPALPDRPSTLNNVVNQNASNFTNQNRFGMNSTPYSGPYSSYSSPYSRFGGGMYGGGMGGGMYGGGYGYGGMYGSGMYGGYGNYPGMPGDPNNQSLTQTWNNSTAATFQIMESIVGAFGGFAQMLESSYMTTRSSFFAMVSMAEQLGNLRQTLGSVLGIFTLMRWLRTLVAKLTGRPPPADATALTPAAFSSFLNGGHSSTPATLPDGSPAPARPSRKPFIMFAIAVFGLPYLMSKLIRAMARSQEEEMRRHQEVGALTYATGENGEQIPIDPKKLDFCRVLYDYTPTPQSGGMDLEAKKGDFVAVLSKTDPMGNASEWWRCRARDGKMGYLPSPYLEPIQRPMQKVTPQITEGNVEPLPIPMQKTTPQITEADEIMASYKPKLGIEPSHDALNERDKEYKAHYNALYAPATKKKKAVPPAAEVTANVKGPKMDSKPGDITPESFQKSAFYS